MSSKKDKSVGRQYFVYDTSYLLQDHLAIEKHGNDSNVLPYVVLQEMGTFKKGDGEINEEARKFQRWFDDTVFPNLAKSDVWHTFQTLKKGLNGRILIATFDEKANPPVEIDPNLKDDRILWAAIQVKRRHIDAKVTLLTYDINLRMKAKVWGIYTSNGDEESSLSIKEIAKKTETLEEKSISPVLVQELNEKNKVMFDSVSGFKKPPAPNTFFLFRNGTASWPVIYNSEEAAFQLIDTNIVAQNVKPRSQQQLLALHALLDPSIRFVAIHGGSGTGKTLLAIAAGLEQRRSYNNIFVSRPVIPLNNKDVGYLPGDIGLKLDPYMQPLYDNFKFIKSQYDEKNSEYKQLHSMMENKKLVIEPLAFIRGRSIAGTYFIVDEAQNLTPLEAKTILTRAAEGTKIVFTGDISQIDTPYLSIESNGLSYATKRLRGQSPLCAVVMLEQGERSELANLANELL